MRHNWRVHENIEGLRHWKTFRKHIPAQLEMPEHVSAYEHGSTTFIAMNYKKAVLA